MTGSLRLSATGICVLRRPCLVRSTYAFGLLTPALLSNSF